MCAEAAKERTKMTAKITMGGGTEENMDREKTHVIEIGNALSDRMFRILIGQTDNDILKYADAEEDVTVTDLNTGNTLIIRWSECGICDSHRCALLLTDWVNKVQEPKYEPSFAERLAAQQATNK
jgi:hypothetical protein